MLRYVEAKDSQGEGGSVTRPRTLFVPGGICVIAESEDEIYAIFIARDDGEDSPRQPAPELSSCPKCGGEIHHAHYMPDETSAGCETYVSYCEDCDWQGEPS